MKVINVNNLTAKFNQQNKPLIAIWGFFDGWHLGHQALLQAMLKKAKKYHYQSLVISFDVKPQSILLKKTLPILLSNQDKISFLANKPVDYYCQIKFSQEFAANSAQDFIKWLLDNNVAAVVVNPNLHFGHKGQGSLKTLQESQLKVFLSQDLFDQKHQKISSTYIKNLIENKAIAHANTLLGEKYTLTGVVVDGIKEGRTLGFPTANLKLTDNYVIPGIATYITTTEVDGRWYQSMTLVINRNNQPLVESYILNFNQNIYGKTIKVQFLDYLRDNISFSSKTNLIAQINQDLKNTITYFQKHKIS
ncbi:MAG: riboflavin biosynthesis protein RibF [Spiroplasma sp.]|nr:riboflavin biosynthesis protein RibF [Spiroplasma sp.]